MRKAFVGVLLLVVLTAALSSVALAPNGSCTCSPGPQGPPGPPGPPGEDAETFFRLRGFVETLQCLVPLGDVVALKPGATDLSVWMDATLAPGGGPGCDNYPYRTIWSRLGR